MNLIDFSFHSGICVWRWSSCAFHRLRLVPHSRFAHRDRTRRFCHHLDVLPFRQQGRFGDTFLHIVPVRVVCVRSVSDSIVVGCSNLDGTKNFR
jgi:hypothetical protein